MDNYRSRQKQHLMEKYGHLRGKLNKSKSQQLTELFVDFPKLTDAILSLPPDQQKELLRVIQDVVIASKTGGTE